MLGLPKEDSNIPPNVKRLLNGFDDEVFGDFLVCPYSKRQAGRMQSVCIESGAHLIHQRLTSQPGKKAEE